MSEAACPLLRLIAALLILPGCDYTRENADFTGDAEGDPCARETVCQRIAARCELKGLSCELKERYCPDPPPPEEPPPEEPPPEEPQPASGCTGEEDLAKLQSAPMEIASASWKCRVDSLIRAEQDQTPFTLDCILEQTGLSTTCATCLTEDTKCILTRCLPPCALNAISWECQDCQTTNCLESFEGCSGFTLVFWSSH